MELRSTLARTIARAERVIAAHEAAASGVSTIWQRDNELLGAFRHRVDLYRHRLPSQRLLLAVGIPGIESSPGVIAVELPHVALALLNKPSRYKVNFGGRGAGRSWSFARALIVRALERKRLVLCAREFQNSISESVYRLLCDQIGLLGLSGYFEIQATTITAYNGSEFIFAGIRNNVSKIKSTEGVDYCLVEEAERISNESLATLIPTVRREKSEIWLAFNTGLADDPVYEKFVTSPPDSALIVKTSYADNPWFPAVLEAERRYLERVDPDSHANIWLGNCRAYSDAVIFKGKFSVEDFTPAESWSGPYQGCDFGFSDDPCAAIRCYVDGTTLYVSNEFWQLHAELDVLAAAIERAMPGARQHRLLCDCSRPESISYLAHHGFPNAQAAAKWPGSILDGIAFLRAFERIVVHSRCTHTLDELRTYSFKIDKLTGQPLTEPEDRANHLMDSCRYSLSELIRGRGAGFMSYYADMLANTNTAPAAPASAWQPAAPTMAERLKAGAVTNSDLTAWHKD